MTGLQNLEILGENVSLFRSSKHAYSALGKDLVTQKVSKQTLELEANSRPEPHLACGWEINHKYATTLFVSLARIFESIDESLMPAVLLYVGCAFHATPTQLGTLTFCRALVQAAASPLGGLMGHYFNRAYVVALACAMWAACTASFALCTTLHQGMFFWALNGFGLAWMIPNGQSLIADYYESHQRGRAFGMLLAVGNAGSMIGALYATNIAGLQIMGLEGWRFAFLTVAVFSCIVGALMLTMGRDPRLPQHTLWAPAKPADAGPELAAEFSITRQLKRVLRTPSFWVIILQGVVGSTPWNALGFLTMYLQLLGFSDLSASVVQGFFGGANAFGAYLGGWVGDRAARLSPDHGRILVCQFSVAVGVPLSALLLKGLPLDGAHSTVAKYCVVIACMGLLITWAATACNNPIFAEVVPAHARSLVYAFDRSFESALASLGAPLVGVLAEKAFHFQASGGTSARCADGERGPASGAHADLGKAVALGDALVVFLTVPWTLCVIFYSLLHYTYPRDRDSAVCSLTPEEALASLQAEEDDLDTWDQGTSGGRAPPGEDERLALMAPAAQPWRVTNTVSGGSNSGDAGPPWHRRHRPNSGSGHGASGSGSRMPRQHDVEGGDGGEVGSSPLDHVRGNVQLHNMGSM